MLHSKPHINVNSEPGVIKKTQVQSPNNWIDYSNYSMHTINPDITELMIGLYNKLKLELSEIYEKLGLDIEFMAIGGLLNQTSTISNKNIDVLIINNGFFKNSDYKNHEKVFIQELIALRNFTYKHIQSSYPEAKINDSRPLSIDFTLQSIPHGYSLYFGLWQCNTTLNPSGYFSNDTSVNLLNHHTLSSVCCNPFKALKNLNSKDDKTNGNARNLIRLLKNIKSKSAHKNHLSGYKIESVVYSMSNESLSKPSDQTISLLIECSLHLKKMIDDPLHKNYILSADGIIAFDEYENTNELEQIKNLKDELNTLLKNLVLNAH